MITVYNHTISESQRTDDGAFVGENVSESNGKKFTREAEITEEVVTQALRIIRKFGNARKVSKALTAAGYTINPSSIYRWTYTRENGGTGGVVPTAAWPYLTKAARLEGILLTPEDMDVRPKLVTTTKFTDIKDGVRLTEPYNIRLEKKRNKARAIRKRVRSRKRNQQLKGMLK